MSRIDRIFQTLRQQRRRALMPFICGGYPTPSETGSAVLAVAQAGAAVIEVGIPFSDPIADGPTITSAMHAALARGATPKGVLQAIADIRSATQVGIVAMVSVSVVDRLGGAAFVRDAAAAGFDGMILPDVPVEESGPYSDLAGEAGLSLSLLVSPSTPAQRAEVIAGASSGFVYLLARSGVTGEQTSAPEVARPVAALRGVTSLPIACGFGISTPEHVRAVTRHADAAIVGSALVRTVAEAFAGGLDPAAAAGEFVRGLMTGLSDFAPS